MFIISRGPLYCVSCLHSISIIAKFVFQKTVFEPKLYLIVVCKKLLCATLRYLFMYSCNPKIN